MFRRTVFAIMLTVILASILPFVFDIQPFRSGEAAYAHAQISLPTDWPSVYFYPEVMEADIGETFTVSVVVFNLTDNKVRDPDNPLLIRSLGNLYGFDIQLSWNATVLELDGYTITQPVEDYPNPVPPSPYAGILHEDTMKLKSKVDETANIPDSEPGTMAWFAYSSSYPAPVFNGNGTFFTLTFNVKASGISHLKLVNVWLSDDTGTCLLFHQFDGFFGECADSFQLPLDGLWTVSQRFGRYNYDWNGYHLGEDVLRNFESPVFAPADGVVKHNAKSTGYGYVVIIEHMLMDGTSVCSVLGHFKQAGRVPVGTKVTKGQIVGYLSSVPEENGGVIHLHFGIRKGMYSEELDFDGEWRYRGYGPIGIVGSWLPPSAFIEYYNLHEETPPSYDLAINIEGGGALATTGTSSVFALVYKTILSLISSHPWFLRWIGADNDNTNPTTVTMNSPREVTEVRASEPPPSCKTPWELAIDLVGAEYSYGGKGWPYILDKHTWSPGKWLDVSEIESGYDYIWYEPRYPGDPNPIEHLEPNRKGVDCSGLVFWAYNKWYDSTPQFIDENSKKPATLTNKNNPIAYQGAGGQYWRNCQINIPKDQLQPGDLLFFDTDEPGDPDHVAMYVGGPFQYNYGDGNTFTYNVVEATKWGDEEVTVAFYNSATEGLTTLQVSTGNLRDPPLHVKYYGRPVHQNNMQKLSFTCGSPVDLVVTDPEGIVLTKEVGEVAGMSYTEFDLDGDGELDDKIEVWEPKAGNYLLTVIPEPGAASNDTFTVEVSACNRTVLLADYAWISEVPTDPYIITQNDTTLMLRNINTVINDFTLSKNVVGQGCPSSINVTVQNQGNLAETFNVTLYANTTTIATVINITLPSGTSTTITFTWNTTGFAYGNYTLWAYAEPVPEETYLGDNTFIYGWAIVSILGDVDGDFDVDLYDAVKLLVHYGAKKGNPEYDLICDIDGDGDIDLYDAVTLLFRYGQKYP